MQLIELKSLWNKGKHNAFSDLCEFNGKLYCCFREAKNHVSDDGVVRIIELDVLGKISNVQLIAIAQADLRDPKLSVGPDGNLLLIAYARHADENNRTIFSQNLCWFSSNGLSWSSPTVFAEKNWWLWRLRWHQGRAFGFAYKRSEQAINFYQGDPRRTFDISSYSALSFQNHGKGYPNESDLLFVDQTAYALIRRDADSYSAQLGTASFPYKRWIWRDLGAYIGGPVMIQANKHTAYVAGRIAYKGHFRTALMTLDLQSAELNLALVLPSSGDNSYPGLVKKGNILYVSYYSSHQDNKSKIYFAKTDLQSS
jgi:hypothetical protein